VSSSMSPRKNTETHGMRKPMKIVILAACWVVASAGMDIRPKAQSAAAQSTKGSPMDRIAEQYVKLVLALGQHDADYVDAYYGQPQWKNEAAAAKIDLDTIGTRAKTLIADIDRERTAMAGSKPAGDDEMVRLRVQYLERQLSALAARVRMLKGERMSFDDESRALYDAVAPT